MVRLGSARPPGEPGGGQPLIAPLNRHNYQGVFSKWFGVAQVTGLGRPATRRTERRDAFSRDDALAKPGASGHSGWRVANRDGRVARSTHYENTPLNQPVIGAVRFFARRRFCADNRLN